MESIDDVRVRELEHRFKNILTITRSIVSQTLRSAKSLEDARKVIDERLACLNGAVDLLRTSHWQAAPLGDLAKRALRVFAGYEGRIHVDGPSVSVGPSASFTLALVIHELVTNAIKYGALSNSAGSVDLTWRVSGEGKTAELSMLWTERGGPPVMRPKQQGFGSRLIGTAASRSFRGRAELNYSEAGVTWSLVAPLSAMGA